MACKYFLPFCRFPFNLLMMSSSVQEHFVDVVPLVDFWLLLVLLVSYPKKNDGKTKVKEDFFLMFPFRSFTVLGLIIRPLLHFELFFCGCYKTGV